MRKQTSVQLVLLAASDAERWSARPGSAIYTVWRYKMSVLTRLVVVSLAALYLPTQPDTTSPALQHFGRRLVAARLRGSPPTATGTGHILHVLGHGPTAKLVGTAYLTISWVHPPISWCRGAFIG